MKKHLYVFAFCALLVPGLVLAQKRTVHKANRSAGIREEAARLTATEAPAETKKVVRDFIAYISRPKPDITKDTQSQIRWLSEDLRKILAAHQKAYDGFSKKHKDWAEEPPSNADFVGAWDYPARYSFAGTRRYGDRVIVDLFFTWGPKSEYPGDTRLASYVLIREGDAWKLDDIYTFQGKFVSASSLKANFSNNTFLD